MDEGSKILLLTLARQMYQKAGRLSKTELLDDAVTGVTSPLKPLIRLDLDHCLDELIDEGQIKYLGRGEIKPTP